MRYERILPGEFISRPNRFIAHVNIGGTVQVCHVKNTGRCRELLLPGAGVYVQQAANPARKTKFDLISVQKGNRLVNIDSAAPNKVFHEWVLQSGQLGAPTLVRPETVHGASRLDFYLEAEGQKIFAEVKGVTLEEDGLAMFPDAPTLRGIKHLEELVLCVQEGYAAMAVFIIQLEGVRAFSPNRRTHPQFAQALAAAQAAGVTLLALGCHVTEDTITAKSRVPIQL